VDVDERRINNGKEDYRYRKHKFGARPSLPGMDEVESFIKKITVQPLRHKGVI